MPWRRSYGDNIVYTDWRRDNYIFAIQEVLRSRGSNPRRLGVEDDSLPLDHRNKIQAAFPPQPWWTWRRQPGASA